MTFKIQSRISCWVNLVYIKWPAKRLDFLVILYRIAQIQLGGLWVVDWCTCRSIWYNYVIEFWMIMLDVRTRVEYLMEYICTTNNCRNMSGFEGGWTLKWVERVSNNYYSTMAYCIWNTFNINVCHINSCWWLHLIIYTEHFARHCIH